MGRTGQSWVFLGVVAFFGCEREAQSTPAPERRAVVAWHPAPLQGQPLGDTGSDCSQGGAESCKSKICLHAGAGRHDRDFYCSVECRKPDNCPRDWICSNGPFPGMRERACLPPSTFAGGVAAVPEPLSLPAEVLPVLATEAEIRAELREAEEQRARGDGGRPDGRRDGGAR